MDPSNTQNHGQLAPWYSVPDDAIMSVEHPCFVKNSLKAIDMLGGSRGVSQSLDAGTEKILGLSFKPQDSASRPILSLHHRTNNVLLKVTVPKRTGRRRKRGSTDEFVQHHTQLAARKDASYVINSLQDNLDSYTIEALGNITSTHVWRNMPDLVFSSKGSIFMQDIENKILPKKFDQMKQYTLPNTHGLEDTELIPPPVLSTHSLPFNYMYRQQQTLGKQDMRTEMNSAYSKNAFLKSHTYQWLYDSPTVPTSPMDSCPPLEEQPPQVQKMVEILHRLFEDRPIWLRRAVASQMPKDLPIFMLKNAIAYVCFPIRSGPWRDALCKFGIDPRIDRKYRKYQTVLLQLGGITRGVDKNASMKSPALNPASDDLRTDSHIFDGKRDIPKNGKVWQLCDLEDEQLKRLVDAEGGALRSECEIRYFGWYHGGVIAKIKILLKVKIDALLAGRPVEPARFERLLQLPDQCDTSPGASHDIAAGYLPRSATKDELDWAVAYRIVARTAPGAMPSYATVAKPRFDTLEVGTNSPMGERTNNDFNTQVTGLKDRSPRPAQHIPLTDDIDGGAINYAEPEERDDDEEEDE